MSKRVLLQTIQFSISTQFKLLVKYKIQFSVITLFSSIWPIDRLYQVLPLQVRVDLGAMAMKGYSESHHQIVVSYSGHLLGESYSFVEMQSLYFVALADWAISHF